MPEWRKDPIVDRWVVIASERGKRPCDFSVSGDKKKQGKCPLCQGNEHDTPPEVIAFRVNGSNRDQPGWWVRVVPNKFPAVRIEASQEIRNYGLFSTMDGLGAHEVVVETAEHDSEIEEHNVKQVEEVIWAWLNRMQDLRKDERFKYIQIFKNYGQTAGASLEHPHSQIMAVPMVPSDIRSEMEGLKKYAGETGRCIVCEMISQELHEQNRVIWENNDFIHIAPYASRFPYETWILPKSHQHDFAIINGTQVRNLAEIVRLALKKMDNSLCSPPYNMVLHTCPVNTGEEVAHYHWHVEILPRLTKMAGFELGTGFYINPTPPELAAEVLRAVEVPYDHVFTHNSGEVARYV